MSKTDKKQRNKAKRQAKRLAIKRRDSISPIKRLAEAKGDVEYWMSEDFEELGQAQMFVYKRAAGLSGVACFLVDQGVVGLKDCWVRMRIERSEFQEMIDRSQERGISMRPVAAEQIRRMVAGGIRWAHENGMRLPKDWAKPASFIGGVSDWASADVSAFVKEFTGHPEDLRQRLIGEPFDTYIQRTDITFAFLADAPFMDQQTGEYIEPEELSDEELESIANDIPTDELNALAEQFVPSATALALETANWLKHRNETPSSELFEAWRSAMLAAMLSKAAMLDAPNDDVAQFGHDLLESMSARIEESAVAQYDQAVEQVLEHLQTDPLMMQNAVLKYGMAHESAEKAE